MQAAGGCLWLKGGGPSLTDEEAALPWSAFGLDLTGEARLRYHAAQVLNLPTTAYTAVTEATAIAM
jgi:hypothetical protein